MSTKKKTTSKSTIIPMNVVLTSSDKGMLIGDMFALRVALMKLTGGSLIGDNLIDYVQFQTSLDICADRCKNELGLILKKYGLKKQADAMNHPKMKEIEEQINLYNRKPVPMAIKPLNFMPKQVTIDFIGGSDMHVQLKALVIKYLMDQKT